MCGRGWRRRLLFERGLLTTFANAGRYKATIMSTIEVVQLPGGGAARLGIFTRDHCPPHATCRETTGAWVARFSFSYVSAGYIGLMSVIPQKNSPGSRTIHALEA